ncbi:MAG: hypothetical protein KDA31_11070, partial [Phycisphaerales bacterium]|nr:hypothetical protein [Phycisphaerales bacterium]
MTNQRPSQPGPDGPNKEGENRPGGKPNQPAPQGSRGLFGLFAFISVIALLFMLFNTAQQGEQINRQQFATYYKSGKVVENSITISETAITAKVRPEAFMEQKRGDQPVVVQIKLLPDAKEYDLTWLDKLTDGNYTQKPTPVWLNAVWLFLPFVLIIAVFWFFLSRGLRSAAGGGGMLGSFGKSKHRVLSKEMTGVTFKDVAGI